MLPSVGNGVQVVSNGCAVASGGSNVCCLQRHHPMAHDGLWQLALFDTTVPCRPCRWPHSASGGPAETLVLQTGLMAQATCVLHILRFTLIRRFCNPRPSLSKHRYQVLPSRHSPSYTIAIALTTTTNHLLPSTTTRVPDPALCRLPPPVASRFELFLFATDLVSRLCDCALAPSFARPGLNSATFRRPSQQTSTA